MAWNVIGGSTHQMKVCKDEQSEQLVLGLVSPKFSSVSQDFVPGIRKRQHQTTLKDEFVDDDDLGDELTNPAEKKRRLTVDQVKYLEMSFNMDLKLEPERKALIAKELGLRPRQVAIWFQNRRARWKNKQLEQDYEALKAKYEAVVKENDIMAKKSEAMMDDNKRLLAEVAHLTTLMSSRGNQGSGLTSVKPSLDSDSDSEIGLKDEQSSGKSELACSTKSEDQTEMQDSGYSCLMSGETIAAIVGPPIAEISSIIACSAVKFEEHQALSPSDEVVGFFNNPYVFLNGFHLEDLYLSWEDHTYGYT